MKKGGAGGAEEFLKNTRQLNRRLQEEAKATKQRELDGGERVKPTGQEIKEKKQQWLNGLSKDPQYQVYTDALALKKAITDLMDAEVTHQHETTEAAKRLISKLGIAIKAWEKEAMANVEIVKIDPGLMKDFKFMAEINPIPMALLDKELATKCVEAIQDERNMLMKDPNTWQQVAEKINQFLEKYLPFIGRIFKVDKTYFGIDEDLEKKLDNFENPSPPSM